MLPVRNQHILTSLDLQVAVEKVETTDASAVVVAGFLKEVQIAQLASATCQRSWCMLGCCKLETGLCLVMSLYTSSGAACPEVLQGQQKISQKKQVGSYSLNLQPQQYSLNRVSESERVKLWWS